MHAPLAAQTTRTAALDATIGAGVGHGGEFLDRQLLGARVAASLRWSRPTRFALFGEVAIDALSLSSGHYAVCYVNPRGGCLDAYPQLIGATITAGLLAPRRRSVSKCDSVSEAASTGPTTRKLRRPLAKPMSLGFRLHTSDSSSAHGPSLCRATTVIYSRPFLGRLDFVSDEALHANSDAGAWFLNRRGRRPRHSRRGLMLRRIAIELSRLRCGSVQRGDGLTVAVL
jgi:hypothetical protein